jgi:hypothetical protein
MEKLKAMIRSKTRAEIYPSTENENWDPDPSGLAKMFPKSEIN